MKTFMTFSFLLLALLSLVGCGSKESSVSLKVTSGFSISAAGYTGGIMAIGEGPEGKKFSVSSNGGQSLNVTIGDGTWKILVVAWEEALNKKFRGTKYCGMSQVNLGSDTTEIHVSVNTTNCADPAFEAYAKVRDLFVSSCGAFYEYDPSGNSYTALADSSSFTFCNTLPKSMQYSHPYYRLIATNFQENVISPGIASECLPTGNISPIRLSVPTLKFPFSVQTYKSLADCEASIAVPRAARFFFHNGIEAGNASNFDHKMLYSGSQAALVLPSSMTRRGTSPFMASIPRILCSSGDCFNAPALPILSVPTPNLAQFDVNWFGDWNKDDSILVKGYQGTHYSGPCDASLKNLLNSSPFFSVNECNIEDGNVKGTFSRNEFTCRATGDLIGIIDIYEKSGKVYLVSSFNDGGATKFQIDVYSDKGKNLNRIEIPHSPSQQYLSMAVDPNGKIFVLMNTISAPARTLHSFSFNAATNQYNSPSSYDSNSYSHLAAANLIEAAGIDKLVSATNDSLRVFTISAIATPGASTVVSGNSPVIKKLQYKNNYLYFMTHSDSLAFANFFDATLALSGSTMVVNVGNSNSPRYITDTGKFESFHVSPIGNQNYVIFNQSTAGKISLHEMNSSNAVNSSATAQYSTATQGYAIVLINSTVHMLAGSSLASAGFYTKKVDITTPAIVSGQNPSPGVCQSQLNSTIAGKTYKLNLSSYEDNNVKMIFGDAFHFLGTRTILSDNTLSYFEDLQDDHDEGYGRIEGQLSRVSGMFSPDGIGGVIGGLFPGQSCANIRDSLPATGSITKSFDLKDSISLEQRSFTVSLSKPSSADMNSTFCTSPGCSAEIMITMSSPGTEKMKMQLHCSSKFGSLESADVDDGEIRHEMILWNTDSLASQRYEALEIEDKVESGVAKVRATITKLKFTAVDEYHVRRLELDRTSSDVYGRITELHGNSSNILSSSIDTGTVPIANFVTSDTSPTGYAGIDVGDLVVNTYLQSLSLYANAGACMPTNQTSPIALSASCTNVASAISGSEIDTNLDYTLYDLKAFTDRPDSSTPSTFDSYFTLQP